MEMNNAAEVAKNWIADVLKDEQPYNIGLEEIDFDSTKNTWLVTVGFSRPWNTVRNSFTAITGEPAVRRVYRVVSVRNDDGHVISMKKRDDE